MDNLALHKPALQSSVSAWSSSRDPAEAARGGNDGDLSGDLGIHTDAGRDPWWQVDLEGIYAVERVRLFNRDAFAERLLRFSVLGSLDGVTWDILASKSDDRVFGPDGAPYTLDLPRHPSLRYLRVRLDGLSCLHFKECQVFGTPADPDAATRAAPVTPDPRLVVFSALYNESDAFLGAYLANFLHYTGPESVLLVNLPPGRPIPDVATNERIVLFNGDVQRSKFGHTLLMGHLESFGLATRLFEHFDYFCPLASNSLFVRRLDPAAMAQQLRAGHKVPVDLDVTYDIGLDIDRLPANWHWPKIAGNQQLIDFLKTRWGLSRLSQNQIEGLVASRADWSLVHARMADLPSVGALLTQETSAFLPLEEILPVTFFLSLGSGCYVNICHVFWNRFNHHGSGRVTIGDLLSVGRYPPHLCLMKWFERDADAIETAAVTRSWGQVLLAEQVAAATQAGVKDRLSRRLLLQEMANSLRAGEIVRPFAGSWRSSPDDTLRPCRIRDQPLVSMRQIVRLPTGQDQPDDHGDAFLYMENTHHRVEVTIDVAHGSTTRLRLACAPVAPAPEGDPVPAESIIEGYLYMRGSWRGEPPIVRVRVPAAAPDGSRTLRRVVVMCDERYVPVDAMHDECNGDMVDYYFSHDGLTQDMFWLGLPFFATSTFEAELDMVEARPGSMDSSP